MSPLVCIILVNYNGFSDTVDCLKSLSKIGYDNYKVIVVDNASTIKPNDDEYNYIIENSIYVENETNVGFSGGNNLGMKIAEKFNPDFYLLINNDTIVTHDFLDEIVRSYSKNKAEKNIGLVTGKIKFYGDKSRIWYAGGSINWSKLKVEHIGYNNKDDKVYSKDAEIAFATGCFLLIPKDIKNTVGELDDDYFLYCEDTDYCIRVINSGMKILYCGESCIYHKVSASTGAGSDTQNYYVVRNTLMLIKRYCKHRIIAYAYNVLRFIKMIICGKMEINTFVEAYRDFKKGIVGKRITVVGKN